LSSAIRRDPAEALKCEQVRRVFRGEPVWEGITWVLDLLHRPRMAIEVIRAYLTAHFWRMPDWRVSGLLDAMNLIRATYLEPVHPREELLSIAPRDFEFVVAELFRRMDYQVSVTQQCCDGGFDLRLNKNDAGRIETSIVECKRYTKNVPVKEMRSLLGVVERDGFTRGLIVTTAGFTHTTRLEASKTHRIELIDFTALCILLNEHFGLEWPSDIDRILSKARLKFESPTARMRCA
jgi:restriction system protein